MKYMGSKSRLSKYIAPIINNLIKENNIDTYIEPFVGGCNMIEHIKCKNKIGYDNNEYLIEMWSKLKQGWIPPNELTKDEYNDIKNNKDSFPKEMVAIAGLCATYNSKWFGGYAGIVHTKINTVRDYYGEAIRNILKQINNLKDVEFHCDSYKNLFFKHTLIYCDPPYQGTTAYSTSKNFDYDVYWNKVREWSKQNIVLCSEYNAPNDFICIYEKTLTTTLDKNSRKKDTEKLFIHKDLYKKIKINIE